MREACIILPVAARLEAFSTGFDRHHALQRGAAVRAYLTGALIAAFGGVTVHTQNGEGAWKADDGTIHREQVTLFTVAVPFDIYTPTPDPVTARIRDLAVDAARKLGQLAVYVRYPSGDVSIIDIPQEDE